MKLMVSLILILQSIKNSAWNKNIESLVEHQATMCCLKLKIHLPCSLPWSHPFPSCILILPSLFILSLAALNWEMIIGGVEWLIAIHKRGNLRTGENLTFMVFSDIGIKVTSYLVLWREELCEFNNEVWGTFTAGKGRWVVCVCMCIWWTLWSNTMYVVVASISEYIVRIDVSYAYLVL